MNFEDYPKLNEYYYFYTGSFCVPVEDWKSVKDEVKKFRKDHPEFKLRRPCEDDPTYYLYEEEVE